MTQAAQTKRGSKSGKGSRRSPAKRKVVGEVSFDVTPDRKSFVQAYRAGKPQVVCIRLVADMETPVSAMMKLTENRPYSFLLESVEGGATRGRYSIIGYNPDLVWRANGERTEVNHAPEARPKQFSRDGHDEFFASLRALLGASQIALPDELPPMSAGVFGYLGYDTIRRFEHLPDQNPDALGTPDAVLMRPQMIAVFDSVKDEIAIVTPVRPGDNPTAAAAERAYVHAKERLQDAVAALERPLSQTSAQDANSQLGTPKSNTTPQRFRAMVDKAKAYIEAGDIFQVVLSQRFSVDFPLPPFSLYRALRRTNPSPYLFHLNFDDFAVVGSSPEILVKVHEDEVTIRPIAGTRWRGRTQEEDDAMAAELLADPKERAEHLMLLDLGRNDVGRVAEPGSVKVTSAFGLEFYSHVMHIVSNVTGRLAKGRDMIDALMGGFPAGTVSGAPKVRAMEIIDELEKDKRGIYAGCVGYFSADGSMDTCIALRTAVVKDGVLHVQAGAGVVADSVPKLEHLECRNKAHALFRAAEEAIRFASSYAGKRQ